jgi:hypothetical protein
MLIAQGQPAASSLPNRSTEDHRLMRESKLSQAPVSNAIKGKPVRRQILSIIREAAAKIHRE